jgi:glycosyltransferase involved in cell wall biosynthesis
VSSNRSEGATATPPVVVYVDVTDTLSSPWTAGIQRVVRGMVAGFDALEADEGTVRCIPLVRVDGSPQFRVLDASERARLRTAPPAPARPAAAAAERPRPVRDFLDAHLPEWATTAGRGVIRPIRHTAQLARRHVVRVRSERRARDEIVRTFEPGAVWFDVDAVWNQTEIDRAGLYQRLHESGVRIVPFVHDVLPIERPEWFVPSLVEVFVAMLTTQVLAADEVLTNSADSAASVSALAARLGRMGLRVTSVELGADPVEHSRAGAGRAGSETVLPPGVGDRPYVLVVGTIEPRKNHRCALDAVRRLAADGPDVAVDLVVAGRAGWNAGDVIDDLRTDRSGSVHWFDDLDDATLRLVVERATLVLVPSITEGYGLPVVEALAAGVPVLSSNGGALAELGARLPVAVELLDPSDPAAWAAAIARHRRDGDWHDSAVAAARCAVVPDWRATAQEVVDALRAT